LQIGDDWPGERITGLNRYFVELTRCLPATGTEAQGLVVGSREILAEAAGTVVPFANSHDPLYKRLYRARRAARKLNREKKFDLVASHFALYAAPLPPELKRLPLVVHFHGPWAAESNVEGSKGQRSSFKFSIERRVYNRARRFIVLSQSFQQELAANYGIDEDRIRLVRGGVDTERFNMSMSRTEARGLLGWPEERPVIFTVRRLVRRMGLENLIDAMTLVVARVPDVMLMLGGAGPIAGELKTRIRERGLENNIQLLGRVSEEHLPLAYRAADMTVVPSQALEGFGLITVESLASGTPVLATPVGGLPEVIQPFAPECLFTDVSADAITSLLLQVLQSELCLPSEERCRAYAVENFSWPRIARQVRSVYDEALDA
jgi:glycosyltransferase involved in cell wall biosynthesis